MQGKQEGVALACHADFRFYGSLVADAASLASRVPGSVLEEEAQDRHEYVDGVVYALPGESLEHNEIAGNLYTTLRVRAGSKSCRVAFAGVKLWIPDLNRYYYPGVMVLCNPQDKGPKIPHGRSSAAGARLPLS